MFLVEELERNVGFEDKLMGEVKREEESLALSMFVGHREELRRGKRDQKEEEE